MNLFDVNEENIPVYYRLTHQSTCINQKINKFFKKQNLVTIIEMKNVLDD